MPKKPRARTLMDSQHVKGSERLLKSARHIFVIALSYFLITLNGNQLEKFCFSSI